MQGQPQSWVKVRVNGAGAVSRRGFLRRLGAGVTGLAGLSWLDRLTLHAEELRKARKSCILLWMAGGPSQFETFDPKPGAETQGPDPGHSNCAFRASRSPSTGRRPPP